MPHDRETANTVGNTAFGSSLKDLEDGDLERGYFDATPEDTSVVGRGKPLATMRVTKLKAY